MKRAEVRFAGEGGQGLILAAVILAETAARGGLHVVQSEQYGPESRGGTTWADVIIGDDEIDYPQATELDVLVALSGKGLERSLVLLGSGGLLLGDAARVRPPNGFDGRRVLLPFAEISRKAAGRAVPPNMAALGALAALTDLMSVEALAETMARRAPAGTAAANLKALESGHAAARATM